MLIYYLYLHHTLTRKPHIVLSAGPAETRFIKFINKVLFLSFSRRNVTKIGGYSPATSFCQNCW